MNAIKALLKSSRGDVEFWIQSALIVALWGVALVMALISVRLLCNI